MPASFSVDTATLEELDSPSAPLVPHFKQNALPEPLYFDSLHTLDSWAECRASNWADAHQEHLLLESFSKKDVLLDIKDVEDLFKSEQARELLNTSYGDDPERPKVLVCHDFEGGYKEDPDRRGYTLEHWQTCDYFVYFSHNRVTAPPPGWITAAHRHDVKILGTLIFEWKESIEEMSLLLRGPLCEHIPLPRGPSHVTRTSSAADFDVRFSPHYANALISLALDRGFDGYLINIEVALELGFQCSGEAWPWWVPPRTKKIERRKNAQRLRAWLAYLRLEGRRRVALINEEQAGKSRRERSWHVCWYDSVTFTTGELQWQDALTVNNQAFFEVCDSIFTNYTWARPPSPEPPGNFPLPQYGFTGPGDGGFHPALALSAEVARRMGRSKTDIFVGVDVFGRNCWGQLDVWRSLRMIRPKVPGSPSTDFIAAGPTGMSIALFAPGWTWEHNPPMLAGREWSKWSNLDHDLWRGAVGGDRSIQHYYPERPIRLDISKADGFYTNFSRGSGSAWWVKGERVHNWLSSHRSEDTGKGSIGWTDLGTCMPQAQSRIETKGDNTVELIVTEDVAWSGSASLCVSGRITSPVHIPLFTFYGLKTGHELLVNFRVKFRDPSQIEVGLMTTLPCQVKERTVHAEPRGWLRYEQRLFLPSDSHDNSLASFGITLTPKVEQAGVDIVIGSYSMNDAALNSKSLSDDQRIVQADKTGCLSWDDFAPHAPFYEVFSETGAWLCSATREWERTQAIIPSNQLKSHTLVIKACE